MRRRDELGPQRGEVSPCSLAQAEARERERDSQADPGGSGIKEEGRPWNDPQLPETQSRFQKEELQALREWPP